MKDKVELRVSSDKGEGIFAIQSLKAGETVLVGVIEERFVSNHSHASQVGENEFVFHNGLITKVNHSCMPNCGIRVNETGGHNFIAMKNIRNGEEVTFDYAMRNYTVEHFPNKCLCGATACRGKITGWQGLSDQKKKEYHGFVAPYLLEMDIAN